jgi:hypothetical protein
VLKHIYHWELIDAANDSSIIRYCHNCGKNAIFKDSKLRRRNANGKTIYEYAIYKCEKDHTWNMPMGQYPPLMYQEDLETAESIDKEDNFKILNLADLKNEGLNEIEIILETVIGRWRLDKLLANRIRDLSRNKASEMIKFKKVLLDGKITKQDALVKKGQRIMIFI